MKKYPILFQRCLLMLGFKLVHLFEKFDVQYLTCGGTLLGQIRGKQLIKHDYDLDYEVPACSRKALFDVVKYVKDTPMYGLRVVLRLPYMVKFVPLMAKTLAAEIKFDRPDVPNPTADVFFGEARSGGGDISEDEYEERVMSRRLLRTILNFITVEMLCTIIVFTFQS